MQGEHRQPGIWPFITANQKGSSISKEFTQQSAKKGKKIEIYGKKKKKKAAVTDDHIILKSAAYILLIASVSKIGTRLTVKF